MKKLSAIFCFLICIASLLQSCIHEYPVATKSPFPGEGDDPTSVNALIEVSFSLSWEKLLHTVDFFTKADGREDHSNRFVIEVIKDGSIVCHDVAYLSDDEYSLGKLTHKLSVPLGAKDYKIGVWHDRQDENGDYPYETEDLSYVTLNRFSTTEPEAMQCAFATEQLDLSDYDVKEETIVTKYIELDHPGARFEIVATDVQRFISEQKEALLQGDSFSTQLFFSNGTASSFNIHSGRLIYGPDNVVLSGRMRLPFDDYEELVIAEGFLFCNDEDEVTVKMNIRNSALVTVSSTDTFTFPVKRGHITVVSGEFLTHPIDGVFSVNHLWDGEIVFEI